MERRAMGGTAARQRFE
jgi:membrane-bound lytic murein transglycosylase MltF